LEHFSLDDLMLILGTVADLIPWDGVELVWEMGVF
jgi:hypothetical protein